MTGRLSKNFHGVGIGPLSKILAVKAILPIFCLGFDANLSSLISFINAKSRFLILKKNPHSMLIDFLDFHSHLPLIYGS